MSSTAAAQDMRLGDYVGTHAGQGTATIEGLVNEVTGDGKVKFVDDVTGHVHTRKPEDLAMDPDRSDSAAHMTDTQRQRAKQEFSAVTAPSKEQADQRQHEDTVMVPKSEGGGPSSAQ